VRTLRRRYSSSRRPWARRWMTQILLFGSSWNRVGDLGSILAAPARHAPDLDLQVDARAAVAQVADLSGACGRTSRAAPGHTSHRPLFSPAGEGQDAGGRVAEDPPHGRTSGGTREAIRLPQSARSSPGWHARITPDFCAPSRTRPAAPRAGSRPLSPTFSPTRKGEEPFYSSHRTPKSFLQA
jgi:hypothetical protein